MPYLADAVPGWFQATLALSDAEGNETGLRRRLPVRSRSGAVLRDPRDGEYVVEIKDCHLPRARGFRVSHRAR